MKKSRPIAGDTTRTATKMGDSIVIDLMDDVIEIDKPIDKNEKERKAELEEPE